MLEGEEFLEVVRQDLELLHKEWGADVQDEQLRRLSGILRRFLIDQELQRAWKMAGFTGQPRITAGTLRHMINTVDKSRFYLATVGGANHRHVHVACAYMMFPPPTPEEAAKLNPGSEPPQETLPLSKFVDEPCMVVQGELISRRVLTKFAAESLGAVHCGTKSGKQNDKKKFNQYLNSLLNQVRKQVGLNDLHVVNHEVLSIGQALLASPDIQRLREGLRDRAA